MSISIANCGECPLIKRHHLGWSEGECQHPKAPGDNRTMTLLNRAGWCPLSEGETVLMAALGVALAEIKTKTEASPVERPSAWERIMADDELV